MNLQTRVKDLVSEIQRLFSSKFGAFIEITPVGNDSPPQTRVDIVGDEIRLNGTTTKNGDAVVSKDNAQNYLNIENALSELANASPDVAKDNLGLGTAATRNTHTQSYAISDVFAALRVQSFGLGMLNGLANKTNDIDNIRATGFYFTDSSVNSNQIPGVDDYPSYYETGPGAVLHFNIQDDASIIEREWIQLFFGLENGTIFIRRKSSSVGSPARWYRVHPVEDDIDESTLYVVKNYLAELNANVTGRRSAKNVLLQDIGFGLNIVDVSANDIGTYASPNTTCTLDTGLYQIYVATSPSLGVLTGLTQAPGIDSWMILHANAGTIKYQFAIGVDNFLTDLTRDDRLVCHRTWNGSEWSEWITLSRERIGDMKITKGIFDDTWIPMDGQRRLIADYPDLIAPNGPITNQIESDAYLPLYNGATSNAPAGSLLSIKFGDMYADPYRDTIFLAEIYRLATTPTSNTLRLSRIGTRLQQTDAISGSKTDLVISSSLPLTFDKFHVSGFSISPSQWFHVVWASSRANNGKVHNLHYSTDQGLSWNAALINSSSQGSMCGWRDGCYRVYLDNSTIGSKRLLVSKHYFNYNTLANTFSYGITQLQDSGPTIVYDNTTTYLRDSTCSSDGTRICTILNTSSGNSYIHITTITSPTSPSSTATTHARYLVSGKTLLRVFDAGTQYYAIGYEGSNFADTKLYSFDSTGSITTLDTISNGDKFTVPAYNNSDLSSYGYGLGLMPDYSIFFSDGYVAKKWSGNATETTLPIAVSTTSRGPARIQKVLIKTDLDTSEDYALVALNQGYNASYLSDNTKLGSYIVKKSKSEIAQNDVLDVRGKFETPIVIDSDGVWFIKAKK